ncbi:MAG: NUDIX hydrolase [Treponema sp.]|jgi:8-oxo-dGTP pyrophosphatase MutT (NUDIX family)|nr:NUDIX hydrolase [Treponema sp.]
MEKNSLEWQETGSRRVFDCPVFAVRELDSRSPENKTKTFLVMDAADWVISIPVLQDGGERELVMVRQWRHGSRELSLEFPGGVMEKGEDPERAAERELREETAYQAGKLQKLGEFRPNPALMSNTVHIFLAEDLRYTGSQELDDDEFIEVVRVKPREVLRGMGQAPYVHALMGSALALYLREFPLT